MSFFDTLMSPISAVGNMIGGAISDITAPFTESSEINSMMSTMNQSNQQVMQSCMSNLSQTQQLLQGALGSANNDASALGLPTVNQNTPGVSQPSPYAIVPDGNVIA